jgi:glycosyltransferase involved in cell wall biosynthesis
MRIAYFLTHPIQYQSPLIRRLIAEGIDLHVYYATDDTSRPYFDPGYDRKISWDVPLLDGYPYTIFNREMVQGGRIRQVARFKEQIRQADQERPADVFWLHGWNNPFVVAAWKVALERGCPIILRGETSLHSIKTGIIGRLLHRWYYQRAFKKVAVFLAMGTLNKELYLRYGVDERKIFLMPHAVDNDFFQSRVAEARPRSEKLRADLGVPAEATIILFCGRLAAEKDVGTLISAVSQLNQSSNERVVLLVVGDGPLKSKLSQLAERIAPGMVLFLGFRNQTELPAYYDLCDIFVLPSTFETWGLVVNEAMNAAKPVIVSDRVGAGIDLVKTGVNGDIFHVRDVRGLAAKIRYWMSNQARRDLGGRASLDIIKKWSLDENALIFQQALTQLIGRNPFGYSKTESPHEI